MNFQCMNADDWSLIILWALVVVSVTFGTVSVITFNQRERNWTSQDHIDYLMGRRSSGY